MLFLRKWWMGFADQNESPRAVRGVRLLAEALEDRSVPAILAPSFDGTGHNPSQPDWGAAEEAFLRISPAAYADGVSSPAGVNRANPREISNALAAENGSGTTNDRNLSAFVYIWGQFIDHDMDLTDTETDSETSSFDIAVPKGDPQFDPRGTGTQTIPLTRSEFDPATGTSKTSPRQQVNSTTAWMDASMIYGSSLEVAQKLRTLEGGKMKTGDGETMPVDPDTGEVLAGDPRATENPGLLSLHVLFLREHNRLAGEISRADPTLSDEEVFQKARLKVIGEIQAITYNEFLPALLGRGTVRAYSGYKPGVNPGISNEFATAAYRVGHSMVTADVEPLDENGKPLGDPIALRDAFFDSSLVVDKGIEPFLKYLASDRMNEIDTKIVDELRNFLFGPPGSGGFDLAALNIQRGRDHGLADYNSVRAAYGLPKVTSFSQITPDPSMQKTLQTLYGNVNNIDLWVGGLAEKHLPGSSVGPTFSRIIADQFQRLRDGDRFWYQNVFSGRERNQLERLRLSDLIRMNSDLKNIQDDVFSFRASISGFVFQDANQDGQRSRVERGLANRKVELVDETGAIIATALTRPDGSFRFEGLDLGQYTVREVLPSGSRATTQPISVSLTRGLNQGMEPKPLLLGESPAAPGRSTSTPSPSLDLALFGQLAQDPRFSHRLG